MILMKLIQRLVPLAMAGVLAGCAAGAPRNDVHSHATAGAMDTQSHCEMHQKMMSGKTAADRQAMMQEHMKSMTPEMQQRMRTMHEQCK